MSYRSLMLDAFIIILNVVSFLTLLVIMPVSVVNPSFFEGLTVTTFVFLTSFNLMGLFHYLSTKFNIFAPEETETS